MDHASFQAWLERYVEAWRSGDRKDIESLFSADAEYYYGPYREPVRGAAAIAADWLEDPDAPGSWEAEYRPLAIDGDVAVAIGESRYPTEGNTYSNIFVCRFDGEGRCTEFKEWYMEKAKSAPADS